MTTTRRVVAILGASALMLSACGQSVSDSAGERTTAPEQAVAPTVESPAAMQGTSTTAPTREWIRSKYCPIVEEYAGLLESPPEYVTPYFNETYSSYGCTLQVGNSAMTAVVEPESYETYDGAYDSTSCEGGAASARENLELLGRPAWLHLCHAEAPSTLYIANITIFNEDEGIVRFGLLRHNSQVDREVFLAAGEDILSQLLHD